MTSTRDAGDRPRRPWTGLHLRPLNVEKGAKRFSPAEDLIPPQAATWRNNLVALSQRRNLLFVAYSHHIYVWEPAGSFQLLGSKPEMIITPVMKDALSQGYIAPHFPHAINSILLDDLGCEEVLLLVTDSGNVCGYHVEAIYSALKREAKNGNQTRPLDGSQVDPFFVEHVEASAWGLAIHKFARLIAVTANTGLITVFAFALVNPSENSGSSSELFEEDNDFSNYDQNWLDIKHNTQLEQLGQLRPNNHRTRNIKLTYTGHFTNIPSVSFLNCDLDPNGAWMVSTDIENKLIVWKVWDSLGPFHIYHFSDMSFNSFPDAWQNDTERGWAAIALDPRSFHPLKYTEEACGGTPKRRMKQGRKILDLTRLNSHIPDTSQLYNHFPPAVRPEPKQPVLPDIFGPDCRISSSKKNALHLAGESLPYSHRPGNGDDDIYMSQSPDEPTGDAGDNSGSNSDVDSEPESQGSESGQNQPDETPRQPSHGQLTTAEFLQYALLEALGGAPIENEGYDEAYSDEEPMDDGMAEYSDDGEGSETGSFGYESDPSTCSHFPIIQFSQTDIHLIPHPFAPHASVICGSPLRQPFTHPIVSIRASDRFNMVKYIPEHGIIVAASQKGRAAIISLTESVDTGVTFRVDWIVPFKSQEKFGDRPLIPLLGMTVAPIQGFEAPPDVPVIPGGAGAGAGAGAGTSSDEDEMVFHYRFVPDDERSGSKPMSSPSEPNPESTEDPTPTMEIETDPTTTNPEGPRLPHLTLPECHAKASRIYQPPEPWRGLWPSRRYRLLLMYSDHTVMSYEFWYDWTGGGGAAGDDGGR